jgi:hypothetical protein
MNSFLKRIIYILGTGSFVVASCKMDYGMPVDIDYFKAVKVVTEDNEPIQGLSVSLLDHGDTIFIEYTDPEGITEIDHSFNIEDSYSVFIEDKDGDDNLGDFNEKTAVLTEADTTLVKMQKKN